MKWEPLLAMAALLLLGLWLVWGPNIGHRYTLRDGAFTQPIRLANARGIIETAPDPSTGQPTFRILLRNGFESPPLSASQFRATFGEAVYDTAATEAPNILFRLFNITSWWSMAWIALGLAGQLAFTGRTLIQWFISERRRESVIPVIFWWLSLAGGIMLFAYFAWRQDVVGVLGQSAGVVIYARNLRLIAKRRTARPASKAANTPAPSPEVPDHQGPIRPTPTE